MRSFSILMVTVLLGTLLGSLTACNTMEGVGEDFKAAGTAIKDTAEETRRKIQ